ncbi:MAG: DUF692 domain-containing protein [Rhodospirillaceae bacterium]|nr:DUF692 domain-containing protein [Rhodospirillaceae bacterium]
MDQRDPLTKSPSRGNTTSPILAMAGVGLRLQHLPELAEAPDDAPPAAAWFEIHSETFLSDGGPRLAMLDEIRKRHPISCHGVGLSLGSAQGVDAAHLERLQRLFERVRPGLVSEHLSWSVIDGAYINDLLPLPYTEESFKVVADNISRAQDAFGRRILIENPSSYLEFTATTMPEWEFLTRLADRTGCGLLLDANNVFVSAANNGFDARHYLSQIPASMIGEIHLAGHSVEDEGESRVLVDTHGAHVCDPVWTLYRELVARIGAAPTLIEWDMDIPAFAELSREAGRAQSIMDELSVKERARVA